MVVEAYFDESGIDGTEVVAVCGFYGEQSAWRTFEKKWNLILRKEHLEGHGFHSKEFWGRKNGRRVKPYETWSDRRANKFLEKLIVAVESCRIHPVGHAIHVKEWFAESLEVRRWLTGGKTRGKKFIYSGAPKRCYYLPFQFCVVETLEYNSEPVHFAFGLDGHYSQHALAIYRTLQAEPEFEKRHLMGQCSFPFSKDTPGLQAADMSSYLLFQWWRSSLHKKKPAWAAATAERLVRRKRPDQVFVIFRKHHFGELVEKNKARQETRRKLRIQHRAQVHSGGFADTSLLENQGQARTVLHYGQYRPQTRRIVLPSDIVLAGRPVFDPRPLARARSQKFSLRFLVAYDRIRRWIERGKLYVRFRGNEGWNPSIRRVLKNNEGTLKRVAQRASKENAGGQDKKKAEES